METNLPGAHYGDPIAGVFDVGDDVQREQRGRTRSEAWTAPGTGDRQRAQVQAQSVGDDRLVQFIHFFAGGDQGRQKRGPCTGGVGSPVE